jgi:hypothetical protein
MAVAWTAIALLAATLFGTLYYLGNKIDALGARMDARFDALSGRIDAQGARIDALGARLDMRMDAVSGLLQAHVERHPS